MTFESNLLKAVEDRLPDDFYPDKTLIQRLDLYLNRMKVWKFINEPGGFVATVLAETHDEARALLVEDMEKNGYLWEKGPSVETVVNLCRVECFTVTKAAVLSIAQT